MPQVINTNVASLNTQRNLNTSQSAQSMAIQRLSSGLRINSAKDDAAGLAISERFSAQIRGLNQAVRNANDGVSLAQTAEGALGQMGSALQRIRELAVQSANATNSATDRAALQAEVDQLVSEITRIGNTTSFNGLKILDGSYSSQQYQVGANANETIKVSVTDSRATQLGAVNRSSTAGVLSTADLSGGVTVNGVAITTSSVAAGDVDGVVAAINAQVSKTGVTAVRSTTNVSPAIAYTATASATLQVNGVTVALDNLAGAAAATEINKFADRTGVTASFAGGNMTFSATNGGDIQLDSSADALLTAAVNTGVTYKAGLELSTKVGSTVTVAGTAAAALNLSTDNSVTYKVSAVDITALSGANDAIRTIDFALSQVNSTRATLGALQSRFEAVVGSLQVASENLAASRSRIMDADFAQETANLTRAQILQQAGTAMLAQANVLPQNVLALLRG